MKAVHYLVCILANGLKTGLQPAGKRDVSECGVCMHLRVCMHAQTILYVAMGFSDILRAVVCISLPNTTKRIDDISSRSKFLTYFRLFFNSMGDRESSWCERELQKMATMPSLSAITTGTNCVPHVLPIHVVVALHDSSHMIALLKHVTTL